MDYNQEYSPIFKTVSVANDIQRIINTIASIWRKNMFGCLSFDIMCSSKLRDFLELRSRKTVRLSDHIIYQIDYFFLSLMFNVILIVISILSFKGSFMNRVNL